MLTTRSSQFVEKGRYMRNFESAFGVGSVVVEPALTGSRFRRLLCERFDIIHLVVAVDPRTGALVFSPVDYATMAPVTTDVDQMSAASFARLLGEAQARLVVLATCKALLLAVVVSNVANMAAPDVDINDIQAAEWGEYFYGSWLRGSLCTAPWS